MIKQFNSPLKSIFLFNIGEFDHADLVFEVLCTFICEVLIYLFVIP